MAQQPLHKAICHVDLDAFYAQVEAKQHPELKGKPLGVVQYNPYGLLETRTSSENRVMNNSNGSLIAVSYEARAAGVKRNMRGDQARAACPEIQLVQVPTAHGKADLTLYRSEGKKVLDILARLAKTERASIDECYLDLTEEAQRRLADCGGVPPLPPSSGQVHVMQEGGFVAAPTWWQRPQESWGPGERLLACAAAAVAELRAAVHAELGYTCSAGIAHTKLLAKLCSGLHKPAQQTVLPSEAVPALLGPLPIPKLKGLGGKFGEQVMSELGIETVGQLGATPLPRLEATFGEKDAQWLAALARGITDDAVEERKLPKSVNCGKTFRGAHALRDLAAVHKWLLELGGELAERLEDDRECNNRVPQLLTATFSTELPWAAAQQPGAQVQATPGYHSTSRSCPLRKLTAEAIAEDATALVRRWAAEQGPGWSISALFVTAGNFVAVQSAASAITRFFKPAGVATVTEGAVATAEGAAGKAAPAAGGPAALAAAAAPEGAAGRAAGAAEVVAGDGAGGPAEGPAGGTPAGAARGPAAARSAAGGAGTRPEDPGTSSAGTAAAGAKVAAAQQDLQQVAEDAAAQQELQQPVQQQEERQRQQGPQQQHAPQQGALPSQQQQQQHVYHHQHQQQQRRQHSSHQHQEQHQQHQHNHQQQQHHQQHSNHQQQHRTLQHQQQPPDFQPGGGIDESVLAELPLELQREIRSELKLQQMAAHMDRRRQAPAGSGSGGGGRGGGNAGGGGGGMDSRDSGTAADGGKGGMRGAGSAKRASSGADAAAAAGSQSIVSFLRGKRSKR